MKGGDPASQTLSALGLLITLDGSVTRAVLKTCTWLASLLFSSWKSEVLCSGIGLRTRAECWDQCALVLEAWVARALGVDFGNS